MQRAGRSLSWGLVTLGVAMAAAPGLVLSHTAPAPFELEVLRWAGAALIGLALTRPWALVQGGSTAARMQRWTRLTVASALLYVTTTQPLFLVVGFCFLTAGALDGAMERATLSTRELITRLIEGRADG